MGASEGAQVPNRYKKAHPEVIQQHAEAHRAMFVLGQKHGSENKRTPRSRNRGVEQRLLFTPLARKQPSVRADTFLFNPNIINTRVRFLWSFMVYGTGEYTRKLYRLACRFAATEVVALLSVTAESGASGRRARSKYKPNMALA